MHLFYPYFIAIECKDYSSAVPISDVEAFITKLEDVGADKGIMVSSKGFQAGAIETAKAHNIELFTLEHQVSGWVQSIRELSFSIPFPGEIAIEPEEKPTKPGAFNAESIDLSSVMLKNESTGQKTTLGAILKDVCVWAHDTKLRLPARVCLKLDGRYRMFNLSQTESIFVKHITFSLVSYRYSETKKIDMPPQITHYNYKDIIRDETHVIDASVGTKSKG